MTALLLLGVLGCPKQLQSPSVTPRALRLLAETPERETTQLTELRPDLEIDTQDFDRTPHVVATGETPLFSVEGVDVRLFGDEAGSKGFQVDNVILLEVLAADGTVLRTVVIGYSDAVLQGNETLDYLGRRAFGFDAGELNLASILPEKGLVRLRATVLDYVGVGRVSDVFVRVEPRAGRSSTADDLRNH